jgi:hypothetical protein
MKKAGGLSPTEHVECGALLKDARNNLLLAAGLCRCYGKLSRELGDAADGLMAQRAWLEKRLIDAVGGDAMVNGIHVRDCYFGTVKEKVDGEESKTCGEATGRCDVASWALRGNARGYASASALSSSGATTTTNGLRASEEQTREARTMKRFTQRSC